VADPDTPTNTRHHHHHVLCWAESEASGAGVFHCTRTSGHYGDHQAHGATWPQATPVVGGGDNDDAKPFMPDGQMLLRKCCSAQFNRPHRDGCWHVAAVDAAVDVARQQQRKHWVAALRVEADNLRHGGWWTAADVDAVADLIEQDQL
jgi:hypothetical protein